MVFRKTNFQSAVLLLALVHFKVSLADDTQWPGGEDGNAPVLSTPQECARKCVDGEAPKICYYDWNLQLYGVMGPACDLCIPTATNQIDQECECITGDGVERMVMVANRMMPGPSIQVCEGDKVVVDVFNNMEGQETTIHWHGVLQNGSQHYDGVPMVTQCPIHQANKFRYQFIAQDAGTHFWHSHVGVQKMNGLAGSLIIRQPNSTDASRDYYDLDMTTTVVFAQDIFHMLSEDKFPGTNVTDVGQIAKNILINGRGQYTNTTTNVTTTTPLEEFVVESGFRYRFRMVNAMSSTCSAQLMVEGHNMTIIEVDGNPVEPVNVQSFISYSGERYDFVIKTDQEAKPYWIQLKGLAGCAASGVQQLAILRYNGSDNATASTAPTYNNSLSTGVVLNPLDGICNETRQDAICISQLNMSRLLTYEDTEVLTTNTPDVKRYMSFGFNTFTDEEMFTPGNGYKLFLLAGGAPTTAFVNNITYASPASPLQSQYSDIPDSQICNVDKRPNNCTNCTCTHMIRIPLNSIVEFILVDEIGVTGLSHPFHMHGGPFHVVAEGHASDFNVTQITQEVVKAYDEAGYIKRRSDKSPLKDVIAVPTGGYAILRFRATNPGFWFMHCHFAFHTAIGMDFVIWIGEFSDLPPVPESFPKCGNFSAPITSNTNSVY